MAFLQKMKVGVVSRVTMSIELWANWMHMESIGGVVHLIHLATASH